MMVNEFEVDGGRRIAAFQAGPAEEVQPEIASRNGLVMRSSLMMMSRLMMRARR